MNQNARRRTFPYPGDFGPRTSLHTHSLAAAPARFRLR